MVQIYQSGHLPSVVTHSNKNPQTGCINQPHWYQLCRVDINPSLPGVKSAQTRPGHKAADKPDMGPV